NALQHRAIGFDTLPQLPRVPLQRPVFLFAPFAAAAALFAAGGGATDVVLFAAVRPPPGVVPLGAPLAPRPPPPALALGAGGFFSASVPMLARRASIRLMTRCGGASSLIGSMTWPACFFRRSSTSAFS